MIVPFTNTISVLSQGKLLRRSDFMDICTKMRLQSGATITKEARHQADYIETEYEPLAEGKKLYTAEGFL